LPALKSFWEKNFVVTWGRKIIEKSLTKIERFLNRNAIKRQWRKTGDASGLGPLDVTADAAT
jgi:hypothetical protein